MLNKVQLIGNLGNDPQTKKGKNEKPFTTFSVATSETWKNDAGEKQTKTEWHNIIANGKLGELAEKYLKKGSRVYLEGKLRYSSSKDENQVERFFTNINIDELRFLDKKESQDNSSE